jgi:hypothetical protein
MENMGQMCGKAVRRSLCGVALCADKIDFRGTAYSAFDGFYFKGDWI